MFAAEVLGNHYRKQAMSDNDRLEANLKREVSAFKSSQHKSNSRLGMSNRTVAQTNYVGWALAWYLQRNCARCTSVFQGLEGVILAQVKIGWYQIEENWLSDGTVDVAISDRRTNELVAFQIDNLEDYDKVIQFLDTNRQIGVLSQLNVANGN